MVSNKIFRVSAPDSSSQTRIFSLINAPLISSQTRSLAFTSAGFTMIELVMVMVLAGILAIAVIPRFANKSAFDERGFFDQSISMVRYAQKVAIAQRRDVFVNVTANTICLTYLVDASCTGAVAANYVINPADQLWFKKDATTAKQAGGSFAAATSFSFSALGRPSAATVISVLSTGPVQTITVEAETGYVH
jgi:MSHA pilin protein MshC